MVDAFVTVYRSTESIPTLDHLNTRLTLVQHMIYLLLLLLLLYIIFSHYDYYRYFIILATCLACVNNLPLLFLYTCADIYNEQSNNFDSIPDDKLFMVTLVPTWLSL